MRTDPQAKELPTFKDNDFISDGQKIHIDDENKKMFLEKLRKDVEVTVHTLNTQDATVHLRFILKSPGSSVRVHVGVH